jgi:hypothetical protein
MFYYSIHVINAISKIQLQSIPHFPSPPIRSDDSSAILAISSCAFAILQIWGSKNTSSFQEFHILVYSNTKFFHNWVIEYVQIIGLNRERKCCARVRGFGKSSII